MKGICGITILASLIAILSIAVADPLGPTLVNVPDVANQVLDTSPIGLDDIPAGDIIARYLSINNGAEIDRLVNIVFAFVDGVRIVGDAFIPNVATPFRNYLSALVRVMLCDVRDGANDPAICGQSYLNAYEGVSYSGDPSDSNNVFKTLGAVESITVNVEQAFLQGYTYEEQNQCPNFPYYGETIIDRAYALRQLAAGGNDFSYDDVKSALESLIGVFAIGGESFQRGLGEKIINGLVYFVNNFAPQYDFKQINDKTIKGYLTDSEVTKYEPFLSNTCNRDIYLKDFDNTIILLQ